MPQSTRHAPLILSELVFRGAVIRPEAEIVTRVGTQRHRQTLARTIERAAGLAHGLAERGVQPGDRVATLMWNDHCHLEAYLAVPAMGAVLHALNLRLGADDLAWVVEDAGDSIILADRDNEDMARALADRCDGVREVVIAGQDSWEAMVESTTSYPWPSLEEEAPLGICHTSGTTGRPRGVVYTHRSTCLHTLLVSMTDFMGLSIRDRVLGVVPMFHALGWGLPYATCMLGADLVLPGVRPGAEDLLDLVDHERATCAAGVPTIWNMIMEAVQAQPDRWTCESLQRIVCGGGSGAAEMRRWYRDQLDVDVRRSWGMTELNPVGTGSVSEEGDDAGVPLPTLNLALKDDDGKPVPHDGRTIGRLMAHGPTVATGYLGGGSQVEEGWLLTGDLATISPRGELTIRDREKDVIKSGGEWISSLELELRINDQPGVAMSAVVARPHPRWEERPIALVVKTPGASITAEQILGSMSDLEKWQRPDDILFAEALPLTGTGKIDKHAVRSQLDEENYVLPDLRDHA